MEPRLIKRYQQLVQAHMQTGHTTAAGIKSIFNGDKAFNQTQAAWRFFNNNACTLTALSQPLLQAGHELSASECDKYMLVIHDWSHLGYNKHTTKKDTYNTFKKCVGYNLQSSLAISDRHGGPLALIAMNLKAKNKTHSTYGNDLENLINLEELPKRIDWLESQKFNKTLVHIADREASSVAFFRTFRSKYWLIRENGKNTVYDGVSEKKIKDIEQNLSFSMKKGFIKYKGKPAKQQIAETNIIITRAAQPNGKGPTGKRLPKVPGAPVNARLVVSRVVDRSTGAILATWYLLSNVCDVSAETLALWYYWRWSIESYFKLLKSAGMQLESWQQTTGLAIARRLLVASMACVCVWRIAYLKGTKAKALRDILVRLSGRQMKWKVEFTHNALLSGLWSLLSIQHTLDTYTRDQINSIFNDVFREKALV